MYYCQIIKSIVKDDMKAKAKDMVIAVSDADPGGLTQLFDINNLL